MVLISVAISLYTAGVDINQPLIYLQKGYKHGKAYYFCARELPMKEYATGNRVVLEKRAAESFVDMVSDAAKDGFHIKVNHSYRTYWEQKRLKRRKGDLAAKPGWSDHQVGRSIDIIGTRRLINGKHYRTILYWWLRKNASKYGFYEDVAGEKWHWTYYEKGEEPKWIANN